MLHKNLKVFTTRKCSRTPKIKLKAATYFIQIYVRRDKFFVGEIFSSPHNDECRDLHNSASNNFNDDKDDGEN